MNGRRRWMLAAAVVAGIALAPAAVADPNSVGQRHKDSGSAIVRGTDGLTYQMSFELVATTGNPSQGAVITVRYKACKRSGSCGFTYTYELNLTSSQVSFPDANTASVTAKLLGLPLKLHWAAPGSPTNPHFYFNSDGTDSVAVSDPTSGGSAEFSATFFGTSCGGNGEIDNAYGAFTAPTAGPTTGSSKLPKGFVTKRRSKPSCQSGG
ncbi:MAG: hypothetical protein QOG34_902 [Frankiaceae bacterium]|nr:hypothetical protein [Frankiaceae bacterium]